MKRIATMWVDLQQYALDRLDRAATRMRRTSMPPHLATGLRGERAALFHLRRQGYTIVAQRWTSSRVRGDVDLIGWHDDWLCFIEVKTRTARDLSPAESAVDRDKQNALRHFAQAYLRAFSEEKRRRIPVRFDLVSVYLLDAGAQFDVFQGAFPWR